MSVDLPFECFLSCFMLGIDINPHLLINHPIELILIRLTHAATDFTEFPCAVVHCPFMKLDFILTDWL